MIPLSGTSKARNRISVFLHQRYVSGSFEWKSGDRFVMHRFDKTSKYVQHRLCVAYAKDLVYVHVEPKLSQKSMPYFDALTSAFLLCTELLAANSLKRFAIPYYAVWRERALQDFDGRAPDGAKFVLENALESYSPATAGYGEAPFRQFSVQAIGGFVLCCILATIVVCWSA